MEEEAKRITCHDEPATLRVFDWHLLQYRVKNKLLRDFLFSMIDAKLLVSVRTYGLAGSGPLGECLDIEILMNDGKTDVFHIEFNREKSKLTWEDFTGYVSLGFTPKEAVEKMKLVLKNGALPYWESRRKTS